MKPIILIAKQRSGTRVLGNLLNDNRILTDFSEVTYFKDGPTQKTGNLTEFLKTQENLEILAPARKGQLIKAYFEHLNALSKGKPFLIDIKYNQIHNFCDRFSFFEKPRAFHLFKEHRPIYIHLTRERVLDSIISSDILKATGKSHFVSERTETPKISIDAKDLINRIKIRQEEIDKFRNFLKKENSLEIKYESLFDEHGNFDKNTVTQLCKHIDCDPISNLTPKFKKSGRKNALEHLTNKEEIIQRLKDNNLSWLL